MATKALIIHGPNLNLLGSREPEVYGATTYADLNALLEKEAAQIGLEVTIRQSNHEGEIVDMIQGAASEAEVIVINPGGYSHTSVAIRDAIAAVGLPVVEVHMSNIHKREPFRHHSYVSGVATGVIAGFGAESYRLALHAAKTL